MNSARLKLIVTSTIPVMMGYVPLGIVFGFLMVQNGAAWWQAPFMSLLVFAGAAQFMAIGLLSIGVSIAELLAAVSIVNLRHVFYGISVLNLVPKNLLSRIYFISTLTDENYSILTGMSASDARRNALYIMAINHFYWVSSALVGSLLGRMITTQINGLEFSLTALFTVLAVEQYRRLKNPIYPAVSVLAYVVATYFAPANPLFPAICIAMATILLMPSGNVNSQLKTES